MNGIARQRHAFGPGEMLADRRDVGDAPVPGEQQALLFRAQRELAGLIGLQPFERRLAVKRVLDGFDDRTHAVVVGFADVRMRPKIQGFFHARDSVGHRENDNQI